MIIVTSWPNLSLVLVLTLSFALCVICGFIKSVQLKLITLLTRNFFAINVLERLYLLLLHTLRKLTSGMTIFLSNSPSNILGIQLANVAVVLMQCLHVQCHDTKHFKSLCLSSPTKQSKQNLEAMSATCV